MGAAALHDACLSGADHCWLPRSDAFSKAHYDVAAAQMANSVSGGGGGGIELATVGGPGEGFSARAKFTVTSWQLRPNSERSPRLQGVGCRVEGFLRCHSLTAVPLPLATVAR